MRLETILAEANDSIAASEVSGSALTPIYSHLVPLVEWSGRWLLRHGVRNCVVVPHVIQNEPVLDVVWITPGAHMVVKIKVTRSSKELVVALESVRSAIVTLSRLAS